MDALTMLPYLRDFCACLILYTIIHHFTTFLFRRHLRLPPGPIGVPILGALPLLGDAPHISLARLAKKYGPIMCLKLGSLNVVVASTPDAARTFLKSLDHCFRNRPTDSAPIRLAYAAQDMVFAEYGAKWKLLRKLSSQQMLGPKALEDWSVIRREEVGRMLSTMLKNGRNGERVKVAEMSVYTLANMIGRVILSRRVFEEKDGEANEFKDMVVELMTLAGLFNIGDFIPALAWMDLQGLERKMKGLHVRFDKVLSRILREHERTQGMRKEKDLLDLLLEYREEGRDAEVKLTDDNIKAVLLNLFTAGTDTSTGTIEWAIAEMIMNPSIQEKAHEEMDRVIGRKRRLEESDIPNLPYLRAIAKESYRKHPSTPLNLPRIATEDCEANGYHIPKNTKLLVNIYAIGRDPDNWTNPQEFNPDRFMTPEGSKIEPSGNNFQLIPFGSGRRICAGARMGVVLVDYVLGSMIHAFDWKMPPGETMDMDETFGIALQKTVPVAAMVSPRLEHGVYNI